jgi:thiol:disulfide interchange protein
MRHLAALVVLLPAVAVAQPPQPGGFGGFDLPGAKPANKFADVADLSVSVVPPSALPGQVVTVKLTITPKPGCTTYPFHAPPEQVSRNNFNPSPDNPLVFVGPIVDPTGQHTKQKDGKPEQVYTDATTWEFKAVVSPKAVKSADPTITLRGFGLLACNATNCFPAGKITTPFEVLSGEAKAVPAELQPWVDAHLKGDPKPLDWTPGAASAAGGAPPTSAVQATGTEDQGFGWFLLAAAGWGLITLITPCVFPMIPITVSLFLKQSHGSTAGAVKQAAIYCLTIIIVLGVPTAFLLDRFQKLSIDPYMNVFLGGLFVFFALSLFGAYEATIRLTCWFVAVFGGALALTSAVVTHLGLSGGELTWAKEGEGVVWRWVTCAGCGAVVGTLLATRRPGSQDGLVKYADARRKAGGVLGTVFGAVLFSVISFTCVAPFLGALAGLMSGGKYEPWQLVLAGLSFSTAFASPFFVLALFPSLIKKMPKSGGWLDVVKAVMGFVELAAAFKFARTAELRWLDPPEYFTYSLCLSAFAVISAVCGLYLLGVFRLPHDDEERSKVSVPRLLFALAFVGLGVYLVPGLFQGADGQPQRPKGVVFAWVDSFLLPDAPAATPVAAGGGGEVKGERPARTLEEAKAGVAVRLAKWEEEKKANPSAPPPDKRLIFVDFTGVTCSNCRLNERNVFPRPEVAALLHKYAELQLYTDTVPVNLYAGPAPSLAQRTAEAEKNKEYQMAEYKTEQLPLYVILEVKADGTTKPLGVYPEGKINDVPAFVEFLRKPLEGK